MNPKIIRVRSDITWQDVVRKSGGHRKQRMLLIIEKRETEFDLNLIIHLELIMQDQTISEMTAKFMRLFLEGLAKKRNRDPLIPETWYNIQYEFVYKYKVFLIKCNLFFLRNFNIIICYR